MRVNKEIVALMFFFLVQLSFAYSLMISNQCNKNILTCQSRVSVTSCFVYKVNWDLDSIDHLCINPIRR